MLCELRNLQKTGDHGKLVKDMEYTRRIVQVHLPPGPSPDPCLVQLQPNLVSISTCIFCTLFGAASTKSRFQLVSTILILSIHHLHTGTMEEKKIDMYTLADARRVPEDQISSYRGIYQVYFSYMHRCPVLPEVLESTVFRLWTVTDMATIPIDDLLAIPRFLTYRLPLACQQYRDNEVRRRRAQILVIANANASKGHGKSSSNKKALRFAKRTTRIQTMKRK